MITEVNQFIFQGDVPVRFNYGCRQYISKSLLVVLSDFHSSNSSGKLTWRTAYCCLFLISLCEALLYCRCKPVRWVLQTNKTKQNKQKKNISRRNQEIFVLAHLKKLRWLNNEAVLIFTKQILPSAKEPLDNRSYKVLCKSLFCWENEKWLQHLI